MTPKMNQGCGRKIGGLRCCTVVLGDCNDFLSELKPGSVDLIVTDPPYGMNYESGREKHRPIHGDDRYPVEVVERLIEIPRLASYFFCRWDNLWDHKTLPKPASVLTWVKTTGTMGDCEGEHGRAYEMALFYRGREHEFLYRASDVLRNERTGNVLHPTQKPVPLIKEILRCYDFETVLDPYMGSGTTGRAAKEMNKHWLGFEIDDELHKTAVEFIRYGKVAFDYTKVPGGMFTVSAE
jgi:DNA modification methylase